MSETYFPSHHRRWMQHLTVVILMAVAPALSARADRIWTKSNTQAKPFERRDLKIQKLENGGLVFTVITSGRQDNKPLGEIWQIEADGETRFNAAEAAFAGGDFAKATTEYEGALSATKAPWVKVRAASRVVEAALNAKNFTAAAKGYAELLKVDPTLANTIRPAAPKDATPAVLSQGAAAFEAMANGTGVSADQKSQLLTIALEFARAGKDNAASTRIAQALTGAEPAAPTTPNPSVPAGNPAVVNTVRDAGSSAQANRRIQLALVALGNKDYAGALKQINEAPEVFTDAAEQVEALYCIAEAKNGTAKDVESLKDAAIDYMRVVARAKAAGIKSARVPDSLYKTAVIHERIRATDEAMILYQQIKTEYPDDASVTPKATAALQRLEKKE